MSQRLVAVLSLGLSLAAAGCGGGTGDLAGKVLYKDKPVVYGTVFAVGSDQQLRTAAIDPDGSYRLEKVPAGEVRLAVVSPDPAEVTVVGREGPKGSKKGVPGVDRGKWFPIPDQYTTIDRSPLTVTVRRGLNEHNIDLK